MTKLIKKLTCISATLLLTLLIHYSCQDNGKKPPKITPENYIILLDLSDRLLVEGVTELDSIMILTVFRRFVNQVRSNLTINSSDQFKLRILPQKGNSFLLKDYEDKIFIDMARLDIADKNNELENHNRLLPQQIHELYAIAYKGSENSDYFGTDIWKYFNEELENDLEAHCNNTVIVLTDGYFDFENDAHALRKGNLFTSSSFYSLLTGTDWKEKAEKASYGLIPLQFSKQFKCIVAGINPKNDSLTELEKLIYFWNKWLTDCGNIPFTSVTLQSGSKMENLLLKALK